MRLEIPDFGFTAGGWRVDRHPRFLADVTGDGRADVVGFGYAGMYVSLNNGDGTFQPPQLAISDFGFTAGGWRVDRHPRFLADVTGDGRADVVGFGYAGMYVSLNNGDGTFQPPQLAISDLGFTAGGWRVDRHPRLLADLTGDGRADVAGFGYAGVYVAVNNGDGTFQEAFTRRNIWGLEASSPWDPTTLAYAKAIKALQQRPLTDPTSWEYLAAVHGRNGAEPPGVNWNECQHGSWYFLSWHRMYLYYFERIVRAEVVAQGGPSDWALPYWDYSTPAQAALPPAFRVPTLPDGSANPLFVTQRSASMNSGGQLPGTATSSSGAMAETEFSPAVGTGFGGGRTTPQHFFGLAGELEFTPHNIVHGLIGGLMGNANLAALDPIFWLHHCNIDRLWEMWLALGGGRANPPDAQWQTGTSFSFHDEAGAFVSLTGDAVNTAFQLGYVYEDISPEMLPLVSDQPEVSAVSDEARPEPNIEMVGASEQPVVLSGAPASIEVAVDTRTTESRRAESAAAPVVLLNLEDIEAEANPSIGYEVYVTASPDPETRVPHYVGTVSFFGIEHASATGPDTEGPHGLRRTFNITRLVSELAAQGQWSDEALTVSFRPLEVIPPPGGIQEPESAESQQAREIPVRIGRVSLFWA